MSVLVDYLVIRTELKHYINYSGPKLSLVCRESDEGQESNGSKSTFSFSIVLLFVVWC